MIACFLRNICFHPLFIEVLIVTTDISGFPRVVGDYAVSILFSLRY